MTGPSPQLPVTFRPHRTRALLLVLGVAACAVIVVVALMLDMSGAQRSGFFFTALCFLGVPLLLARPHVTADEGGVTVVNLTTRRRLEWPEVLAVHLRNGDPWVFLDLADGTSLPAMGIQPGIAREQAIRDAKALRELAERHGAAG
ncbi:PH domain-containing protein [Streptomyces sulphureus]|uniref:PH domain-containing protein n=1 Tax=Streptomyces sulphureus TaxID=47758 RepID=UPI00035C6F17|nr:PH domain-containing protein [Streptomyces sulphureus]